MASEEKKARLRRQYAGSRVDLSESPVSNRRGSVSVGSSKYHRNDNIDPETLLLPLTQRRRSRRASTVHGLKGKVYQCDDPNNRIFR